MSCAEHLQILIKAPKPGSQLNHPLNFYKLMWESMSWMCWWIGFSAFLTVGAMDCWSQIGTHGKKRRWERIMSIATTNLTKRQPQGYKQQLRFRDPLQSPINSFLVTLAVCHEGKLQMTCLSAKKAKPILNFSISAKLQLQICSSRLQPCNNVNNGVKRSKTTWKLTSYWKLDIKGDSMGNNSQDCFYLWRCSPGNFHLMACWCTTKCIKDPA